MKQGEKHTASSVPTLPLIASPSRNPSSSGAVSDSGGDASEAIGKKKRRAPNTAREPSNGLVDDSFDSSSPARTGRGREALSGTFLKGTFVLNDGSVVAHSGAVIPQHIVHHQLNVEMHRLNMKVNEDSVKKVEQGWLGLSSRPKVLEPTVPKKPMPEAMSPPRGALLVGEYDFPEGRTQNKKKKSGLVPERERATIHDEKIERLRIEREEEMTRTALFKQRKSSLKLVRKRDGAALKIQARFKGMQTRHWYNNEKKKRNKAAVAIQAGWRGHHVRAVQQEAVRLEKETMASLIAKAALRASDDAVIAFSAEELAEIREQFNRVDLDHNGVVDRDEFTIFYSNVAFEQLPQEECTKLFDQLDSDHSGELGFDEFTELYHLIIKLSVAKKMGNTARAKSIEDKLKSRLDMLAKWRSEERARKEKFDSERRAEIERLRALFEMARTGGNLSADSRAAFFQRRREEAQRIREEDEKMIEEARMQREVQLLMQRAAIRAARARTPQVPATSPKSGSMKGANSVVVSNDPASPTSSAFFTDEDIALLKEHFNKFDVSGSGEITREEFHLFYNSISLNRLSAADSEALFRELDVDGSGVLTFDEFVQVYDVLQRFESERSSEKMERSVRTQFAREQQERRAQELLHTKKERERMRAEHRARLRLEEVGKQQKHDVSIRTETEKLEAAQMQLMKKRHEEAARRRQENERIIAAARDRTEVERFLNKAKMRLEKGRMNEPFSGEDLETLRAQFDRFDLDGSGDISIDEFALFYNSIAVRQLSVNECDALFDELDVDHSGVLTFDQFTRVYNIIQLREEAKRGNNAKKVEELNTKLFKTCSMRIMPKKTPVAAAATPGKQPAAKSVAGKATLPPKRGTRN